MDAMSDVAATCDHDGRLSEKDSDLIATGMQLKPWEHELFQAVAAGSVETALDILRKPNRIFSQNTLDGSLLKVCKLQKQRPTYLVEKLISLGANIEVVSEDGCTPMIIAANNGNTDLFTFLLRRGADVNAVTAEGESALTLSIRPNRSLDIMKLLLQQKGIDKNHKNHQGYTALMKAIEARDFEAMKLLIDDHQLDISVRLTKDKESFVSNETIIEIFGQALFEFASRAGIVKVIKLLLCTRHGQCPFMEATLKADLELMNILIDSQFYNVHKEDSGDTTFLQNFFQTKKQRNLAIGDVDIPVVKILLENGAAVNRSEKRYWLKHQSRNVPPLITAVEVGSLGLVQLMCKYGAKLDVTSNYPNKTPLDVAAESGKTDILQFLLSKHAHANSSKQLTMVRFEQSALHLSLMNGHTNCADILIKHGYKMDVPNAAEFAIEKNKPVYLKFLIERFGWDVKSFLINHKNKSNKLLTPVVKTDYVDIISSLVEARMYVPYFLLRHATSAAMVQLLVRHGSDVNRRAKQTGDSVLLTLIQSGKNVTSVVEIVKVLLEKGANVNTCNSQMFTPLMAAARKWESSELLNTLLLYGANVNTNDRSGSTAVLYAVEQNFTENAKFLINLEGNQKVDFEVKNTSGSTPLLLAAKNRNKTITELLIARGADVNVEDPDGNTALTMVARYGGADTLKKIIERGADINHQNKAGCSALMFAALNHSGVSPLNILLNNAANVNIRDNEGNTALLHAIQQRHTDTAAFLIEHEGDQKTDFDVLNLSGSSALISAVKHRNKTITDLLIARGANVNIEDNNGDTALTLVAKTGDTDTMKKIIETGADVDHQNKEGYSALMFAAQNQKCTDLNPLKLLLQNGASVNITDNKGNTALLHAVELELVENVKYLFEYQTDNKVDVDVQNTSGSTALMLAVKHNHKTITDMLIDQRADVNVQDQNGDTALTLAARNSDTDRLMKIIKSGADINHQNKEGHTALMYAAKKYSDANHLKILLHNGASVNIKDNDGNTALLHAVEQRCTETATFLIVHWGKQKVNVDAQNTSGATALILAIKHRMKTITDLLIAQGANVSFEDNNGDTALTSAAALSDLDAIKKIIERGANINHQNKAGYSALMIAARKCHKDSIETLLNAGADVNVVSHGQEEKTAISLLLETKSFYNKSTVYLLMNSLLDKGASASYLKLDAIFDLIQSNHPTLVPKLVSSGFAPAEINSAALDRSERWGFPKVSPFIFALRCSRPNFARYFDGNWFLSTSDIQLQAKHQLAKKILERRSNKECVNILDEFCSQPISLLKLSFVTVSSAIGCVHGREERVEKLPLPPLIKDKLLFKRQEVHLDIPESATPSRESTSSRHFSRLLAALQMRLSYQVDDDNLYDYVYDSDDDYNPYDYDD